MNNSKVNLIIFSKDRAAQLHLLLQSIWRLEWAKVLQPIVIYKASSPEYQEGYFQCMSEWAYPLFHRQENLLQIDTNEVFEDCKSQFTAFSTDDMTFFKRSENDLLNILANGFNDSYVFSLRLGKNTIIQDYHRQSRQASLNLHIFNDGVIKWNPHHYHAYANYGYPLAVDCHVLRTEKLRDLCNRFRWSTTNELESGLQKYRNEIMELWSYPESVAVNIPCNSISGITKAGEKHAYSVEELNTAYLQGRRIDLDSILSETVVGCHQEMELKLL